jgi:hypothetical protein
VAKKRMENEISYRRRLSQWLYDPNTAGNFLIHEWAYQDGEMLQTIDIDCKAKEGLAALQIVIDKLISAEEETRKESRLTAKAKNKDNLN